MAVVAVAAVGILIRTESGVASPVSVATAFMDANSEHDVDAMWELFAPDSEAKLAGLAAMTAGGRLAAEQSGGSKSATRYARR